MTAVLTEVRDRVLIITLNRPEVRNAVDGDIATGVEAAIDQLEENDDLLIGIITGNGSAFCAGADLKVLAQADPAAMPALTKRGHFAGFVNRERTKPVIAAVNGAAVAGGFEIVLACDLVVATTTAVFGLPEAKRSLVAFAGGIFRSPRALPLNVAMEIALTGEPIDVQRAYSLGFVNRIVEPATLLDEAMALGRSHRGERAAGGAGDPPDRAGRGASRRSRPVPGRTRSIAADRTDRGLPRGSALVRREAPTQLAGPLRPRP